MPLDLDAIRQRRDTWKTAAADGTLPVPNRILLIAASANDIPPLLNELDQLHATAEQLREDLDRANTHLTTAIQGWRSTVHRFHSGPLDRCQRTDCLNLQGHIPRAYRPTRTGA